MTSASHPRKYAKGVDSMHTPHGVGFEHLSTLQGAAPKSAGQKTVKSDRRNRRAPDQYVGSGEQRRRLLTPVA